MSAGKWKTGVVAPERVQVEGMRVTSEEHQNTLGFQITGTWEPLLDVLQTSSVWTCWETLDAQNSEKGLH